MGSLLPSVSICTDRIYQLRLFSPVGLLVASLYTRYDIFLPCDVACNQVVLVETSSRDKCHHPSLLRHRVGTLPGLYRFIEHTYHASFGTSSQSTDESIPPLCGLLTKPATTRVSHGIYKLGNRLVPYMFVSHGLYII